jgi:hypothetical protein
MFNKVKAVRVWTCMRTTRQHSKLELIPEVSSVTLVPQRPFLLVGWRVVPTPEALHAFEGVCCACLKHSTLGDADEVYADEVY